MKETSEVKENAVTFEISFSDLLCSEFTENFLVNLDLSKKFDFDVVFEDGLIKRIYRSDNTIDSTDKKKSKRKTKEICEVVIVHAKVHVDFSDLLYTENVPEIDLQETENATELDLPEQVQLNCIVVLSGSGAYELFLTLPEDEKPVKSKKSAKSKKSSKKDDKHLKEDAVSVTA